jgi:hypothetical protein
VRVYLDNCCFNRPFDDQRQTRVRLEAEVKLWHGAKIIPRFIGACILAAVHQHSLVSIIHCLRNLAD